MIGCGGGGTATPPSLTAVNPAYGPLSGGTRVVITGQGFLADGAPPNRVVFGTTEAPLAAADTDTSMEVEVPPSTMPGPVPVVVFNQNGSTTAMGLFHYSTAPTITSVTPSEVLFSTTNTTVTVTGTGFQDESAGVVQVTLDGVLAFDVTVASDTQLTFTAPAGPPMVKPTIELANARGTASGTGFRYVPSTSPGLIVFSSRVRTPMAVFYDPVANVEVQFPQPGSTNLHVRGTFIDANGDYWGVVGGAARAGARGNNQFGKLDFRHAGTVLEPIPVSSFPTGFALVGTTLFAWDRQTQTFGKLDQTTGTFTRVGVFANGCGAQLLFSHNGQINYSACGSQLSTFDTSGTEGTVVTLSASHQYCDMRFVGNMLFALDTTGNLYTVNPSTGTVSAPVHTFNLSTSAMEVFNP